MNFLYIYGWGSNSDSSTARELRKLLPDHMIISINYDQLNPLSARNYFDDYLQRHFTRGFEINGIIASSYGAYIALRIRSSISKFLINPCLNPLKEIDKINGNLTQTFIEQYIHLEKEIKIVDDEDMRFTTAFFGEKDELFSYKEEYLKMGYFKYVDLENEGHKLSQNGLQIVANYIENEYNIKSPSR